MVSRRNGSTLLVVVVCVTILAVFAALLAESGNTGSKVALEGLARTRALAAADAGIGLKLAQLGKGANGPAAFTFRDGTTVAVAVEDLGANGRDDNGDGASDDPAEVGNFRLESTARAVGRGATGVPARCRLEAYVRTLYHPLFYKALYSGNRTGANQVVVLGPGNGNPRAPANDRPAHRRRTDWDTMAHSNNADYVEGDVFVHGSLHVTGQSDVFGKVDGTGGMTGRPVEGTVTTGAPPIPPPDLIGQSYAQVADTIVTASSRNPNARISGTHGVPPFIFADSYAGTQPGVFGPQANEHDRHNFMLGARNGTITIPQSWNGKLVLVKGNLWLSSDQVFSFDVRPGPGEPASAGRTVTIVVEGNVYLADDIQLSNPARDGLLIIAKSDPSSHGSYTDLNLDLRRQSNEPLIDSGAPYAGPREGQGNVWFGDPRFGTGGIVQAYVYAENNVYLSNPPPNVPHPQGNDAIFGVLGFLNAGNQLLLGPRQGGGNYTNYRVKYDDRVQRGAIQFKGMPRNQGGALSGLAVVAWRELP